MEIWWSDAAYVVRLVAIILFGLVTLALLARICEYAYQMARSKKKERLSLWILAYLVLNFLFNGVEFSLAFYDDPSTDPNVSLPLRVLSSSFLGPASLLSIVIHILLCSPFIGIQHIDPQRGTFYARVMVGICIVVHFVLLAPNYISFLNISSNALLYYRMGGLCAWIIFTVAVDLTFSLLASRNMIRVKLLGSSWNVIKTEKESTPFNSPLSPIKSPLFFHGRAREKSGSVLFQSEPMKLRGTDSQAPFPFSNKANMSSPILPTHLKNALQCGDPSHVDSKSESVDALSLKKQDGGTNKNNKSSKTLLENSGNNLVSLKNSDSQAPSCPSPKTTHESVGLSSPQKPQQTSLPLTPNTDEVTSVTGTTRPMKKGGSKASLSVDTRPSTLSNIPSSKTGRLFSPISAKSTSSKMKEILTPHQIEAFTKSKKATMRFAIMLASFDIIGLVMFGIYVYFRMRDQSPMYQCFRMLFYVCMTGHHLVMSYFWILLRQLYGILSMSVKEYHDRKRKEAEAKQQRRRHNNQENGPKSHKLGFTKVLRGLLTNKTNGWRRKEKLGADKAPRREEMIASMTPDDVEQQRAVQQQKIGLYKDARVIECVSSLPSTDVSGSCTTTELDEARPTPR